jgi:hypothetical protein
MTATESAIYNASIRQIAGLEVERHAHLMQIEGLVDERNALRQEVAWKIKVSEMAAATIDALREQNANPAVLLADLHNTRTLLDDERERCLQLGLVNAVLREQNSGLVTLLANARQRLDYYRKLYAGQIAEGDMV